jgi:hypothetical protein
MVLPPPSHGALIRLDDFKPLQRPTVYNVKPVTVVPDAKKEDSNFAQYFRCYTFGQHKHTEISFDSSFRQIKNTQTHDTDTN